MPVSQRWNLQLDMCSNFAMMSILKFCSLWCCINFCIKESGIGIHGQVVLGSNPSRIERGGA